MKISKKSFKGKINTADIVGNVVGGAGSVFVDKGLDKITTMSTNTKALVKAGIGIVLPMVSKNPYILGASEGMLGVAAYQLTQENLSSISGLLPGQSSVGNSRNWIAARQNPINAGQAAVATVGNPMPKGAQIIG